MRKKYLKKTLARLKRFKNELPSLIECSMLYGDNYYTNYDLARVKKEIAEIEQLIINIDLAEKNKPLQVGTLNCPFCNKPLHFHQAFGIRLIENGYLSGYCPKDKEYFQISAN